MRKEVIDHFNKHDSTLARLARQYPTVSMKTSTTYFADLAENIVCQQLSEKAGATIWKRFQDLFLGRSVTPVAVQKKSVQELRSAGVSNAKATYIHAVADAFRANIVQPELFHNMADEDVIATLVQIKGVGRWTAEMFLIFSLGREDVYSCADVGLTRAVNQLYGKGKTLTRTQIEKIMMKWKPYRSYACLLLWKTLET